jgi:hypothetical protein
MIGLDVDTSTIPAFTQLTYTEDFIVEGDIIRIQYFYLGLPFGPDVIEPALSLFVDAVLITETPLTEGVNVTLNHYITVTDANISINLFGLDISEGGLEDELESGL